MSVGEVNGLTSWLHESQRDQDHGYGTRKTMEAKGKGLPREGFVERGMWWTNKGTPVARRRPDFPFDLQGPGATGGHLGASLLVMTWVREARERLTGSKAQGWILPLGTAAVKKPVSTSTDS
ncbi:predicted protein [Chaetomium globosum CBS 148.51]|uniref:Uncharacterized protein n=1 Tax=Chaetomium globosum (strain ATCC 6205 / CBS 148.51 / DSM 1962 / NBRC 6347 / NRRL 1970) TaxID=306901 RepID=Q2HH69_CHAGB|nr:uncharacterized protein CHGG_00435 [Chaetomium globosum CBS 148.51]EAQ92200.1 predicted protein [Chaetomium globosum CBS 148.51]